MGLRVTFELGEDDLEHFRLIMQQARTTAARIAPEDIVAAAEDLLQDIGSSGTPGFIQDRIDKLRMLMRMYRKPMTTVCGWQAARAEPAASAPRSRSSGRAEAAAAAEPVAEALPASGVVMYCNSWCPACRRARPRALNAPSTMS